MLHRDDGIWGFELDQFEARLSDHPGFISSNFFKLVIYLHQLERLNNLYFTYLLVLRAVNVSADFLLSYDYDTHHPLEDAATVETLNNLLGSRHLWPLTFDETEVFQGCNSFEITSKLTLSRSR